MLKIKYYCGYYYIAPNDPGTYMFEDPPECGYEGTFECEEDEWEQECAWIKCPRCHNELTQEYDAMEIIK